MYGFRVIYLLTMARIWHVKLHSYSDPIPSGLLSVAESGTGVCSQVPTCHNATVIHSFSSRPLRRHARQRAPTHQQISRRRRLPKRPAESPKRPAEASAPSAASALAPPPRRRVGAVVASKTRLVSRRQRRAGSRRRPAAVAQAN